MTELRTAAQQALEALQWHYRQGHSNTIGGFRLKIDEKALRELSAALAQQDEPVLVQGELPPRYVARSPIQAEPLNLTDPAVQKRLAAQWGYVHEAQQAEPVEPVAWLAPDGSVRETTAAKSFGEWVWGPDDFRPLYTAPPQRKPLTEEVAALTAQRDALLEALKLARSVIGHPDDAHTQMIDATIKAVEGGA